MPPRLFPSTDLHLLVGAVVPLRAFALINGSWTDLSTLGAFAMGLMSNTGTFVTLAARQITAQAGGVEDATLRVTFGGTNINVAFRATVHHRMNQIMLPSAGFAMEVDRTDRVLTVYGQFETAGGARSTHDVTGLPYLRYSVTTTGAAVVSVDANGRVSTVGSGAGTATVEVSIDPALAGTTPPIVGTLQITVVDAVTDRPILEAMHVGASIRKRSIVVVAEGFTSTQKAEFDQLAGRVATRMLEVSPYSLLRESFDIYTAFVPSQDDGVTLAPPIIPLNGSAEVAVPVPPDRSLVAAIDFLVEELLVFVGNPAVVTTTRAAAETTLRGLSGSANVDLSQSTFDIWRSLATAVPVEARVRESFFGFQIGERHFSTAFAPRQPATTATVIADVPVDFMRPRDDNRTPFIDERRLPDLTAPGADPATAHVATQDQFLRALRVPGGPMGFGATWATGGENFGLVVFLINSDHYAGVRRDNHLAMSIGGGIVVATQPSLLARGLIEVEPVPRPITFWSEPYRRGFRETPIDVLVDTMAHELAHSLALGNLNDEYGGAATPPPPAGQVFAEDAPNTQVLANARNGTTIDPLLLKWNWERVEAAVHVEALSGSGTQLAITTIFEDMIRWPFDTVGRVGLLRRKDLRSTSSPKGTGLTIRSVDIAANKIHVELPASGSAAALISLFSTGSTFVMPRVDASSNPVTLVQPDAFAEMLTGPFAESTHDPATNACTINDAGPPFQLGAFWNRMQVLGAYESGAQFNCGVIRPAGECKMRKTAAIRTDTPVEFCFVCKYAIVEAVDCAVHALLDREYPR
jgi:IgA Peptidase M64